MDPVSLYHRGLQLTTAGRYEEGVRALRLAAERFERDGRAMEHAKTLNALGAALRDAGRPEEAAATFEEAAPNLEGRDRGAALYNLGLAKRETGDLAAARDAFDRARSLLDAPAVARELGTTLLQSGEIEAAVAQLEAALRAGDEAAANPLGLAYLAAGRTDEAVDAFRQAVAAHPRSVRPSEHAMAKANLALAHERAGDAPRARLAARQALGVPAAPPVVVEQATVTLARLGPGSRDLLTVLSHEARERWPALVREEVVRWADADDKRAELAEWVEGLRGRDDAVDLAEAWLAALLELPPAAMQALIAAARDSCEEEWFRTVVDAASARFHTPQLLRLRESFGWT